MKQPIQAKKRAKRKGRGVNYINNAEFTVDVAEYVRAIKGLEDPPGIPNKIGNYFLKLCTGLSMSPNFKNYTYREDMVMDAVENCIKVIANYDIDKPTRTGKPNPFSYFTQIAYFAFLRRIAREKRQTEIKDSLIANAGTGVFAEFDDNAVGEAVMGRMRLRNTNRPKPTIGKKSINRKRQTKKTNTASLYDA